MIAAAVNSVYTQCETAEVSSNVNNDFVFVYFCVFCEKQINSYSLFVNHLSNDHFVEIEVPEKVLEIVPEEEIQCTELNNFNDTVSDAVVCFSPETGDDNYEGDEIQELNECTSAEKDDFIQNTLDATAFRVENESETITKVQESVKSSNENEKSIEDEKVTTVHNPKHTSSNKVKSKVKPPPKTHFECIHCDKVYRSKSALVNHRKVHETIEKRVCPFSICSKSFTSSAGYFHHLHTHTKEIRYPCPSCDKGFYQKCNLQTHIRRCHTHDKPYKCQYCTKTFASRTDRQTHERFHTGEKPFACDICEKRFTTSTKMNYHRKIHFQDKKFCCKLCNQIFTTRGLLYKHRLTHNIN